MMLGRYSRHRARSTGLQVPTACRWLDLGVAWSLAGPVLTLLLWRDRRRHSGGRASFAGARGSEGQHGR